MQPDPKRLPPLSAKPPLTPSPVVIRDKLSSKDSALLEAAVQDREFAMWPQYDDPAQAVPWIERETELSRKRREAN